jgi:hypothetical protein
VQPETDVWNQFQKDMATIKPQLFTPVQTSPVTLAVALAYDAARSILIGAKQEVESGLPFYGDDFVSQMFNNVSFEGLTQRIDFNQFGDNLPNFFITNFVNGEFVPVGRYYSIDQVNAPILDWTRPVHWRDGSIGGFPSSEVPRHLKEVDDWAIIISYLIMAFGLTSSILFHYMLHSQRDHAIIRASSIQFCHVIVAGGSIAYIAAGIETISVEVQCRSLPGLLSATFSVIFGALFAKTYRIV